MRKYIDEGETSSRQCVNLPGSRSCLTREYFGMLQKVAIETWFTWTQMLHHDGSMTYIFAFTPKVRKTHFILFFIFARITIGIAIFLFFVFGHILRLCCYYFVRGMSFVSSKLGYLSIVSCLFPLLLYTI